MSPRAHGSNCVRCGAPTTRSIVGVGPDRSTTMMTRQCETCFHAQWERLEQLATWASYVERVGLGRGASNYVFGLLLRWFL